MPTPIARTSVRDSSAKERDRCAGDDEERSAAGKEGRRAERRGGRDVEGRALGRVCDWRPFFAAAVAGPAEQASAWQDRVVAHVCSPSQSEMTGRDCDDDTLGAR